MTRAKVILALALLLVALLLSLALCRMAEPVVEITPTLVISATPSDTPAPPTITPSSTVAPVTLTATGTAVPPTPTTTATVTAEAANLPTVAPTEKSIVIYQGLTYWGVSKAEYGKFEAWQCLKARNGWPERALPIGAIMIIPGACND